jgi:hypothetical protein
MTSLIPSISVPGLLAERQARIDAAHALFADPHQFAFANFLTGERSIDKEWSLARYLQHEERRCWKTFIQASGLWDLFPRSKREEWMKVLRMGDYAYRHLEDECPQFTQDAAMATFQAYAEQKGELRKEALLSLFERRSWDHATNQPALFGEKLIYQRFAHAAKGDDWCHISIHWCSHHFLDDLLREMYRFDGKPEPVGRWDQHENANGYFHVQTFKNGNAHIHLERTDLVDRMNAEIARHFPGALPPPSKVKRKQAA